MRCFDMRSLSLAALVAGLVAVPALASAQSLPVSVEGGYMSTTSANGTNTQAGAAAITLHGLGVGLPGTHPQITLIAPLSSGGGQYAATAEDTLRLPLGVAVVGAGVGIGRLGAPTATFFGTPVKTGALYDVLAGVRITRNVDLVGRYYDGFDRTTGQAVFAGVDLHI
jgi:hypothetical protein